jgi:hypothetical protein
MDLIVIDDIEKYNSKCIVIKNLILEEFNNDDFEFNLNDDTNVQMIIINKKSTVTILPNNSWNDIKRNIIKKINETYKNNDCSICFEKIKQNISCNQCSNNWCGECYINLFRNGNGIIKCPVCRYSFGIEISECMVDYSIREMKNKFHILYIK